MIYLYAVVPGDAAAPAPGEVEGIDGGEVRLLPAGAVAAVVGEVADAAYGEEALEARLRDLAWVGERGAAHERVLLWFADRGPVVPLSLFSLHRDRAALGERLAGQAERLAALLARLRGRREWRVRLWREAAEPDQAVDARSPALRALADEIAAATPGRRFLLEKKRASLRAEERRRLSAGAAQEAMRELAGAAVAAAALPHPEGAERPPVLNGAFLVEEARFDAFRGRVAGVAARADAAGLRLEFTGPWPPYHFARFDER